MSLLEHLPLNGSPPEAQAVNILCTCLRQLGSGAHSLNELQPDDKDFQWLKDWAANLTPARLCIAGWHTGALLLFLAAEVAQREAQEGHVWPPLPPHFQVETTRRRLFTGKDQPTDLLYELLEQAARNLNVRHVFDLEDTQRWYVSTYLQFGFTYAGAEEKLSDWLSGHPPTRAIEMLLDPQHGSRSFRQFWSTLRFFRRDYLTESQTRQRLRDSPWVLPSRVEEMLAWSRRDTGEPPPPERCDLPFLDGVRLEWEPPEVPRFRCGFADLAPLGLTASRYHVRLGEQVLASLFRQPDGSYRGDEDELVLPCDRPYLPLTLEEDAGLTHTVQVLELWDAASEVNVFTLAGTLADSDHFLAPNRGYIVQMAADAHLCPEPSCWQAVGGENPRVWAIVEEIERVCVRDAREEVLWLPRMGGVASAPDWAECIQIDPLGGRPHVALDVRLSFQLASLRPDVEVAYVRLNGQPLDFDSHLGTITPVEVTPELALAGWRFRIGLRREGVDTRIERRPRVPILGAARWTEQGWRSLTPDHPLSVRDARETPWRLFLPSEQTERRVALLEGDIFLGRIGEETRRLAVLSGTGAPLVLRKRPYNCPYNLTTLASGAIDFGLVRWVEWDRSTGRYRLLLHHGVEPGPEHRVICWSPTHGLHSLDHVDIRVGDARQVWEIPCPWPEDGEPLLCAVAYQGQRLGFAWLGEWHRFFAPPPDGPSASPCRVAALFRWFRLPVLLTNREIHRPLLEDFAEQHPADLLAAWLCGEGLDGTGLEYDDSAERHKAERAILRHLYADWRPDDDQARAILDRFAQSRPNELPALALTEALLPDVPLLVGRVLDRGWLRHLQPAERPEARMVLTLCYCRATGLPDWATPQTRRQRMQDALEQASRTMRADANASLDANFICQGIADPVMKTLQDPQRRLNSFEVSNLAVASGVGSFRQYLGLRVLEQLLSQL